MSKHLNSKNSLLKRFAGNAALSLLLRISWAVLNYLGVVLLARWLAHDDYGRYGMIMSIVTFMGTFTGIGAQTSVIRFVSQYKAQDRNALMRGVVAFFLSNVMLVSLVTTGLLVVGILVAGRSGLLPSYISFAIGVTMIPAFALIDAQAGVARSQGMIFFAIAPKDVLWRASIIPIGYVVVALCSLTNQLDYMLVLSSASLTFMAFLQRYAIARRDPALFDTRDVERDVREWKGVAGPLWISSIAGISLTTVDVLVVGALLSPAEAGRYFAAARTAILVSFFLASINLIIGPMVSNLYYSNKTTELKRLLRFAAVLVFTPSLLAFIFILFFGREVLSIFGPEFPQAKNVLLALAAGQLVNAATGSVAVLMNVTGHQAVAAKIQVFSGLIISAMLPVGTYLFGATGAACISGGGLAAWNIVMWLYVRRTLGMDPSILGTFMPMRDKPIGTG